MLPEYKHIVSLIKKGSTLEAQEKIMELREAAIQLQVENQGLKDKILLLEQELEIKGKLTYEKPYYWLIDGQKKDGPYCQVCYDREHKLIRLQDDHQGRWHCHVCRSIFYESSYSPHQTRRTKGKNWLHR